MMKRNCFLLIIAVLLVICSGCVPTVQTLAPTPTAEIVNTDTDDLAALWQEDIDLLRKWQNSLPDAPDTSKGELSDPKPDLMEIFSILDHLSVKEGWVLDYGYYADGMGAAPVLYAHQPNVEPISMEELEDILSGIAEKEIRPGVSSDYMSFIIPDGSELGYLQLAQLMVMGGQFYLDWHANYNDHTPFATEKALNTIINENDGTNFGKPLTNKEKRATAALDLTPTVEVSGNLVRLRYITFTKWGGFREQHVTIELEPTLTLTSEDPVILVPYNCEIMF